MKLAISPDDVRAAAERIVVLARRSPVMTSARFNQASGVRTYFKCENLQKGGAFKIRGAANLILSLPAEAIPRGVVAYSSGNHAQATAIAAKHVGAAATIVMPEDAPRSKLQSTQGYGAKIVTYDRRTEQREAIAERILSETGGTLVPPFDHPMIMAGQGTAALELLEDVSKLDALIAPVGGGGLLSGCAVIARAMNPSIRIFGAEPEGANDTCLSMEAGQRVEVPHPQTIADGLRSPKPGALTFPVIQALAERIILVTDDEIRSAMRFLLSRMKILVEPSGAASAAAVLHRKLPEGIGSVGVILSGGNVDIDEWGI